jgi:hypothetical protein
LNLLIFYIIGLGFHTRDQNDQDVDEEVDVDGDDEAVFGDAQFTEGDILGHNEDEDVHIDDEDEDGNTERKTLRDLVAEGKVVRRRSPPSGDGVEAVKAKMEEVMGVGDADKMDLAVSSARRHGNSAALIQALENKIKQLVSSRLGRHSFLVNLSILCSRLGIGINARIVLNVFTLSDLLGPVYGTNSFDGLLAYML